MGMIYLQNVFHKLSIHFIINVISGITLFHIAIAQIKFCSCYEIGKNEMQYVPLLLSSFLRILLIKCLYEKKMNRFRFHERKTTPFCA